MKPNTTIDMQQEWDKQFNQPHCQMLCCWKLTI